MQWQDKGFVLSSRRHGETSAIVEILTEEHGRHAGVVRGGASRRMAAHLQPGTDVLVTWRARLEEHLGTFQIEPLANRAHLLSAPLALSALGSLTAMISMGFPERMSLPDLQARSRSLLNHLDEGQGWLAEYALWELAFLRELGFGLELSRCAATGGSDDLIYVSPKSGRAVSASAGRDWADKMLPLPEFLRLEDPVAGVGEVAQALKTTGYFLEHWLAQAAGIKKLPEARHRFVTRISQLAA